MPRSIGGVIAWARAHANDRDWAGWCEKFINNGGAFNQGFNSAKLAGDASAPFSGTAQVGMIGYWLGAGGDGHDAFVVEAGGDPLLLMASSAVTDDWGNNLGLIRASAYARKGLPFRGYSFRHGSETLDLGGSTAGSSTAPLPASTTPEEDTMGDFDRMRRSSDGSIVFADMYSTEQNVLAFKNTDVGVAEFLQALLVLSPVQSEVGDRIFDVANSIVYNRSQWYANMLAQRAAAATVASLTPVINAAGGKIDEAKLAKMVEASIKASVAANPFTTEVSPEDIAELSRLMDERLKDDFAAIPKGVNDDAAKRLQS